MKIVVEQMASQVQNLQATLTSTQSELAQTQVQLQQANSVANAAAAASAAAASSAASTAAAASSSYPLVTEASTAKLLRQPSSLSKDERDWNEFKFQTENYMSGLAFAYTTELQAAAESNTP